MDRDNQDHKKLQATSGGHESHGVHLCHQCGWPFPNPHPSAKYRRAHKKVCGTIEGYKLPGSASASASASGTVDPTVTVSDNDNLSDDDAKPPVPKHTEKNNYGKNSVGISERLGRSEDDVFSDAVTEFPESGFTPGIEVRANDARIGPNDARITATDVEKGGEKNFSLFYSFNDNSVADIVERSNNSIDSNQMHNPDAPENAIALPESNPESQVHVSISTEESAAILTDDNSEKVACDFQPVEHETPMPVLQENKVMNGGDAVRDGLIMCTGQETDAKGSDEIYSERNIAPSSPTEYPGQTPKAESKCSQKEKITSDPMSAAEVVLSKEDNGAELVSKTPTPLGDPIRILESVELSDPTDSAQNKVSAESAEQELNLDSSVNSMEGFSGKGEGNENVHKLSVPADIPVIDNAERMLEDFKDHRGVKLHPSLTLDSAEIIQDKKDDFGNPVYMEDHDSLQTTQLSEFSKVSTSDMHVVEGNLVKHQKMHVVSNPSAEGERNESQIKLTSNDESDEFGAPTEAVTIGMEQGNPVSFIENQLHSNVSDDSLHVCAQETAVIVSHDVNTVVASSDTNVIDLYDTGNHKNPATEMCDIVGKNEKERVKDEDDAKNLITASESGTNFPEFQVNPAVSLRESSVTSDHKKGKIKKCVVVEVISKEENSEEKLLLESKTGSESDSDLHESQAIDEDKIEGSLMKLPETKVTNIEGFSDIPDMSKKLEVKGSGEVLGEFNYAEHGRNIDSLQKTSEVHATKAPLLLPSDAESLVQTSVVDNSDTREHGTGHSGIDQASQGENSNNKHQYGASAIDASVDSSSQTESLEGNWGSVSVLSTLSDIPVLVDSEALASEKAEKSNLKEVECATERQHAEKFDIFDAPSFMTLVEPGSGSNQKATISDINTVQNLDQIQARSQAGWFPSLSHTVNESQGRKKNEEIIAKVTKWSTGKQHTPLKNLLTEANLETKPKTPNQRENEAPVIQKDNTVTKENKALVTTVGSILGPEAPNTESVTRETRKEPNSQEMYPADIKRERRKVKGRPYWAQFVCCSSAN